MLNRLKPAPARALARTRQQGVVLMMALIVLVAMTLAGIALVRSVDTSNVIAGNLAFQQAATHASDASTEAAASWLQANNSGDTLHSDIPGQGYAATTNPPLGPSQSWDNYWQTVLKPNAVTLPTDAAGNTVAYSIQRMCLNPYAPNAGNSGCEYSTTTSTSASSSKTAGTVQLLYATQVLYRITTRIAGPRNTVSYVQTIIAVSS